MAFCGQCGTKIDDGIHVCPNCGNVLAQPSSQPQPSPAPAQKSIDYSGKLQELNNTADTTDQFDPADIQQNKAMAVLAYLGILVLIPLFAAKHSKFARYHTNQGLVLALASIAYSIVYGILSSIILAISWRLSFITSILSLVSLVFFVLSILGIVNAVQGRAKELPLVGKIKIIK